MRRERSEEEEEEPTARLRPGTGNPPPGTIGREMITFIVFSRNILEGLVPHAEVQLDD